MIKGVNIVSLKQIPDERGKIMHMLRCNDKHFEQFGEIYFSIAYPQVIKGWHEHTKQTQNYAVIKGMIKLVLYDNRPESETYKQLSEYFIGEDGYKLVTIPKRVINGYKVVSTKEAIVANCATHPHEPNEMIRHDPFTKKIPYKWDIVMK